jgi:hypothetical protein
VARGRDGLATIEEQPRARGESRLLEHLSSRLQKMKSEQLESRGRGGSVGRRRLQDVFLNF